MKIIWFVFLFFSFSYTSEIICLVPRNIKNSILPLFSNTIPYTKMKVIIKGVSIENTINMLNQSQNIKFAIVRRDILWQIQQGKESKQKSKYITIGELPYKAQLFLLQNSKDFDIDIDMLKGKTVSIGVLEDKNTKYIKNILNLYQSTYNLFYKSFSYKKSINGLHKGLIDVYFTFLPTLLNIDNIHKQTLFSKEVFSYFENLEIFEINYNGIFSPYILVASEDATDEEIENIIYRLMEKKIFNPITDTRFGIINQYVITHLESVKKALQKESPKINQSINNHFNSICRKYHYGFLKLLREKPLLKKKLQNINNIKQKQKYIKQINKILINIDAHKSKCNLTYLKKRKKEFYILKKTIGSSKL